MIFLLKRFKNKENIIKMQEEVKRIFINEDLKAYIIQIIDATRDYKKFGLKTFLFSVLLIVFMITFTDQICNAFKHGFKRFRPCRQEGVMEQMRFIAKRCGRYGFFSAHAASSMAAAVFSGLLLRPYYKKLIFILLLWSATVAYSRIYVGVHYPLDILVGAMLGVGCSYLVVLLNGWLAKTYAKRKV